jgi:chromosome segregation ATPase
MAKKPPARRAPTKKPKKKPTAKRAIPLAEKFREAMEELEVAREELSRLGHAMTAANRELEEHKLSAKSARDNLSAQLEAMRADLKLALAELEIARTDREQLRKRLSAVSSQLSAQKLIADS